MKQYLAMVHLVKVQAEAVRITILLLVVKITTIAHQNQKMIILNRLQKEIIQTSAPLLMNILYQRMANTTIRRMV